MGGADNKVVVSSLGNDRKIDGKNPDHWMGNGPQPSHFQNPWPSFTTKVTLTGALKVRFGKNRNFVPVPEEILEERKELVPIRKPNWGGASPGLKTTWIGHASFYIETTAYNGAIDTPMQAVSSENLTQHPAAQSQLVNGVSEAIDDDNTASFVSAAETRSTQEHSAYEAPVSSSPQGPGRGIRIFLDPVFAERMGPFGIVGPKRFSPTPCQLSEVPKVDLVLISHNHYDHLDVSTIKYLVQDKERERPVHFVCPMNNQQWLMRWGVKEENITVMDWWDSAEVTVPSVGSIRLTCTPAQHTTARTGWDGNVGLWCSYVIEEYRPGSQSFGKKLFFAGDTGYRSITEQNLKDKINLDTLPHCPAFKEIGEKYGPFDLALLPIGCYSPRHFMAQVHCAPEDSICIHKDIKSKKSLGMHYGTLRGGISAHYEDVREPPRLWREGAEKAGLEFGKEIILADLGETVVV